MTPKHPHGPPMTLGNMRALGVRARVLALVAVAINCGLLGQPNAQTGTREDRHALWNEIRPMALKNCTLRRFGSVNDGGYLLCENLISGTESAYSYGISTEDNWGCKLSRRLSIAIHQYDCFTPHRPVCSHGRFVFHSECLGLKAETIDSRRFDTLAAQIARNGDNGKRLLVKMDVEGAEWESLLATPDELLEKIDQLAMELHGVHFRCLQRSSASSNGLFILSAFISIVTAVRTTSIRFRRRHFRCCS